LILYYQNGDWLCQLVFKYNIGILNLDTVVFWKTEIETAYRVHAYTATIIKDPIV